MFVLFEKYFSLFCIAFSIFAFTVTVVNGQNYQSNQYGGNQYQDNRNQCDHNRLQDCQRDISTYIQDVSNSQSGYTGMSSGYQSSSSDTHQKCSALRQKLDCLLEFTPACQQNRTTGVYGTVGTYDRDRSNAGDFVRRARQTLERYCEQGGGGYKSAACFTRQEIRDCESRHGFSSNPPSVSSSGCRNYQDFRDCVIRIVRNSCYNTDLQLMATYLIDKAQDLSWSCVVIPDYGDRRSDDSYRSGSGYDSRYQTNYGGQSGYDNRDRNYDNRDRNYDNRDRNYDNRDNRYGNRDQYGNQYGGQSGGQYGSQYGSNQGIDRYSGGSYMPTSDSCVERARYFVQTCEDTLISRQRDAREGRSATDVQRRVCCALYFYRDCISRVVLERCPSVDGGGNVLVNILMGSRQRDISNNCQMYSRDQCSGALITKSSLSVLLSIFISLFILNSNVF